MKLEPEPELELVPVNRLRPKRAGSDRLRNTANAYTRYCN